MEKLIEGLRYFQSNVLWQKKELFEECVLGQRPFAMLITCSDSRILPEALLQLAPGDLFVARNAGNFVPAPGDGGGEAAAIEYAVKSLGITDLIVCGHYRCGAVNALLHPMGSSLPEMTHWLRHASEAASVLESDFPDLAGEAKWDKAVELNVLIQLKHLSMHPAVAEGLEAGTIRLHPWVVRFETGQILAECPELERFIPLLELPAIRAAALQSMRRTRTAARPSAPGRMGGFRWNVAYAAMSVLSLMTLVCVEGCGDGREQRVRGTPPASIPIAASQHVVAHCSGSCDRPPEKSVPEQPVDMDRKVREWQ